MIYQEISPVQGKNAPVLEKYLWVQPVKGYTKDCQNISKYLEEVGFTALKKEDIYFKTMDAAGKSPGTYSSKLKIQLDPAMRSVVFCQVRLIRGPIHEVNIRYQEINKTTRHGFFALVVKVAICSEMSPEIQISAAYR